jgi:hypothetical protein
MSIIAWLVVGAIAGYLAGSVHGNRANWRSDRSTHGRPEG